MEFYDTNLPKNNAGGERLMDLKCLMAHAETLLEEEYTSFFLATKMITRKQEIPRLERGVFCKFYKEQQWTRITVMEDGKKH